MLEVDDYKEILNQFPEVEFAFAYGSGVVEQGSYNYSTSSEKLPMLDMIFAVDNSECWHQSNFLLNPHHYTSLLPLPSSAITYLQENFGGYLWYNAIIKLNISRFPNRTMKYGVISKKRLLEDLTNWSCLYSAGRLHKPVRIIKNDIDIEKAIEINKESAIRTSLLLLPDLFSEKDLYLTIASLSYVGDPRMIFGENPKKVVNLVTPILPHYRILYTKSFDRLSNFLKIESINSLKKNFSQNISTQSRLQLASTLPSNLKNLLYLPGRAKYLKYKPPQKTTIRAALASIVARAASAQSVKGIFTAGIIKSSEYIFSKLSKSFLALK